MEAVEHLLDWHETHVGGRVARYGVGGTGDPIVFLHGWGLTNRTYRAALKRLTGRGFQVWAPALPGFGGTAPLPREVRSLVGYATWVDEFMATVGIEEHVVLMGHSFGGGVAIQVAHDFPERVRSLVLINSIGGSAWRTDGSLVRSMAERPLWDWGLHLPADVLPTRQVRRVLPVILDGLVPNVLREPRAFWHAANIARGADLVAELETLKERELPVAVLWGDRDQVVTRASVDALCDALGADCHTVPGGHSWLLADPDAFGEVITNIVGLAARARDEERVADEEPLPEPELPTLRRRRSA